MERKINKLENSHVEVICTVDEESWKKAQAAGFKKVAAKVEVPGFRKGKAPENLVKSKVDQVKVMDEAINVILPELYKAILDEDGIKPYVQPKVDITKLTEKELEVKFVIVTAPEVKLGDYKSVKVKKEEAKVTKEEIDNAIDTRLAKNATLVVKDDVAKEGDTVVIDFVGKVDGKEFEGGSSKNYELALGSHSFIPGFEEQLVGHKAGEHVDVNVTFPEQYTEELKGKPAVFACDIHEVKEKKLPTLDDEFVKDQAIDGVNTLDELRAYEEKTLKDNKARELRGKYLTNILEEIAKISTMAIPEEVIDSQVESRRQDMTNRMAQSGLTIEQYCQIVGQTKEQFDAQLKERATTEVKNYLILEEIAVQEKLNEVTDKDLDFEYAKIADQYKMKIEDVKKAIGNNIDEFKNNIKMTRVEDFLFNLN